MMPIGEDRWSWRAPVVVILVALTAVMTAAAVVSGWTRLTIVETTGYVEHLAAPLAADPEVKDAVATEMAHQMIEEREGDFATRLKQWVPEQNVVARAAVDQWATQLEQGWREGLQPAIRAQLDLETFNDLWVQANADAHRQLIRAFSDSQTASSVTLDLHHIAQASVRETGKELDRSLGMAGVGEMVYDAIAESLPPEVGMISVDVSRVGPAARQAIAMIDLLVALSFIATVLLVLLVVAVAPPLRRGSAVLLLGLAIIGTAGVLWFGVTAQTASAGDRAAAVAAEPLSPEMRLVVNRQAELAAASFVPWAVVTAAAGVALCFVGGAWRMISLRRHDPFASSYAQIKDTGWSDPTSPNWSAGPGRPPDPYRPSEPYRSPDRF